jgi:hypothetical protein
VASAVEDVVEQRRKEGELSGALEIAVRVRHESRLAPATAAADLKAQTAALTAAGLRVSASVQAVPAADADPLAIRPVAAPAALCQKLPFKRHIEESRPYLVLGEGVRMINAHPMAVTVFWGGLTNWVLGYILAGHHVASTARLAVLIPVMVAFLATCLVRIGRARELRLSVREMRIVLADPAARARIAQGGNRGWLLPAARIASFLLRVRGPNQALPRASVVPGERKALTPRMDEEALAALQVGSDGSGLL